MPSTRHFVGYGADERRKAATPVHIARVLGELANNPALRIDATRPALGADSKRPLDVSFFGTKSPHRARFLARNAERLSRYESMIYLRTKNALEPMNASTGEAGLVDVACYAACHARVLLNVHRDEFPYFEWHRLVCQGMANRSVVVSEPCFANPQFDPGVHYLAEEAHHLMDLVEWVLNDTDGQAKADAVAEAAFLAVHDPNEQAARAGALVALLTA